jgi:hypothetical protein
MDGRTKGTSAEDKIHREGVLAFLLYEAELATIDEVVAHRQVAVSADRHDELRDGTERAINDLASMGVVNVEGRSVYATRAARETGRLL